MTNPAEYISGRTVQEQMNELISYVDTRAASVALDAIASDMATLAQAVQDAQDAQAAAEQARDTAISTVSDCVKKTPGASQTITGQDLIISGADVQAVDLRATGNLSVSGTTAATGLITASAGANVPTEATGTYSSLAANSTKVKNELDNYSAMVRTTGNQTITGTKENTNSRAFISNYAGSARGFDCKHPTDDKSAIPSSTTHYPLVVWDDKNDNIVCMLRLEHSTTDGKYRLIAYIANAGPNGSGYAQSVIATGGYS